LSGASSRSAAASPSAATSRKRREAAPAKPAPTVAGRPGRHQHAGASTPIAREPSAARSVVRAASSADCRPAAARRRSVALPARVPENYAERDALMKRMISAKPDRANPFTDRGARTKRAR
jgi:hypothetical protein